jgi:hypothetical protein
MNRRDPLTCRFPFQDSKSSKGNSDDLKRVGLPRGPPLAAMPLLLSCLALLLLAALLPALSSASSLTGCAAGTAGPDCCGAKVSGGSCGGFPCYDPSAECCYVCTSNDQTYGWTWDDGACLDLPQCTSGTVCVKGTSGCTCTRHCSAGSHGGGGLSKGGKIAIAVIVVIVVLSIVGVVLYFCWWKKRA